MAFQENPVDARKRQQLSSARKAVYGADDSVVTPPGHEEAMPPKPVEQPMGAGTNTNNPPPLEIACPGCGHSFSITSKSDVAEEAAGNF